MADRYSKTGSNIVGPSSRSTPVVPNDTTELANTPKAILVGTGGTIVGQLQQDTTDRTFKLPAGLYPLRFRLIKATGTTATDMIAFD